MPTRARAGDERRDGERPPEAPGRRVDAPAVTHPVLRLQRTAGNRAVGQLAVQRGALKQLEYAFRGDEELTKRADGGDVDAIKTISDYGKLDDARRMKYVGMILAQSDLGWRDKRALHHLWSAYGEGVLSPARANPDAWAKSIAANGDIGTIGPLASAKGQFTVEVRNLARGILASNDAEIVRQFDRLGADENGTVKQDLGEKDQARLAAQQKAAAQIVAAQDYQRSLEGTIIGYDQGPMDGVKRPDGVAITFGQAVQSDGKVTETKPFRPPPPGGPTFEQVKLAYELSAAVIRGQMTKWPALYSVVGGSNKAFATASAELTNVAAGKPDAARTQLLASMKETKANIAKGRDSINDPDLPLDLTPLHKKLMTGAGALPWGDAAHKPVVDGFLKGHSEQQAMEKLGLATLAALAFIVAELATGGMATFFIVAGVATSVGTAALAIDEARDKRALEGSAISDETRLLEEGKASEATVDAVLTTILSVVDVALAAKAVVGVAKASSALKELETLAPAERAAKVEKLIDEIGATATVRASGKTISELVAMLPAESRAAKSLSLIRGEIAVGTGLGSAKAVKAAADAAEGIAKEWAQLTSVEARAQRLEQIANKALQEAGTAPTLLKVVIMPEAGPLKTGRGALYFDFNNYRILVPSQSLGLRAEGGVAELVAAVHHEARHAEQWYSAARRLGSKDAHALSKAEIMARTHLPEWVVDHALANPLKNGAPEVAAVEKWIQSFGTPQGDAIRSKILRDLEVAKKNLAQAKAELASAERSGIAEKVRVAKNNLEDDELIWQECYKKYRSLAEEADAHGVSEAIESELRKRQNLRLAGAVAGGATVGAGAALGAYEATKP